LHAVAAVVVLGVGTWLIFGLRESIYRVPVNQLTVAAVTRGPFEDYVAGRGTAAPLATHFLTAEQGGVVKEVLVKDGKIGLLQRSMSGRRSTLASNSGARPMQ
jgi:multidrug efflux pump subunit AcrA (membrane-fusion protein)